MVKKRCVTPDYEVGYRRPPKATQFAKGQSGNPGGKRRGPPSVKDTLAAVMGSDIVLAEDGQRRTASKIEAVLLSLVQTALRGNTKAAALLLTLCERHQLGEELTHDILPGEDRAILERAISRRSASAPPVAEEESDG